ncbi:MAG: hypothetical protein ACYC2O_11695, partial [Microthrixaceae bacterium]
STTSQRTIGAARETRVERYTADGSIKAAINWAKDNTGVALDPDLAPPSTPNPCVYHYEGVTVSCVADAGSGSGEPAESGQVPPEALLMLGERHAQTGPFNVAKCNGLFDTAGDWFTGAIDGFLGSGDLAAIGLPEKSAVFLPQRQDDFWSCGQRSRTFENFAVEGKIVAAGQMLASSNTKITAVQPNSSALLAGGTVADYGCEGDIQPACNTTPANRADGSAEDTDPARTNPNSPAQNPTDIRSSWQSLPISGLQRQTSAYFLNPDGTLTPTASCAGADRTVVFKPGWYQSAEFLNGFTANPACSDVTFWFAPDAGPDGRLLTDDDTNGAFLMDFRTGAANTCHDSYAKQSRWCIGGTSSQSPRVVVGFPAGWSPINPSGGGSSSTGRLPVAIGTAGTVDNDLSVRWYDPDRAKTIDGSFATYSPCSVFGLFNCPSSDRSIRVRDFTPDATGPPISESGHPAGRLYLTVAYGLLNGSQLNPSVVVEAVSPESGRKSCGTYALPNQAYSGSGAVPSYTFSDAEAEQLAAACGSVDLINGLEVKLRTTGNTWNSGNPRVYLDGVRINYVTFSGASFPTGDPTSADTVSAKSDCDPTEPGGQLIFTGESHVYVADGSLEVCAGPYPTDPENHQQIGLWAVPAVAPVVPSNVAKGGADTDSLSHTGAAGAARLRIGEPGGRESIDINYGGISPEGQAVVTMNAYQPPAGFKIKQVDMRVSFNPNSSCFLWCIFAATPYVNVVGGNEIELPRNPSMLQYANNSDMVLYRSASDGSPVNKIDLAKLADGTLQFVQRARSSCWCGETDQLEGIELDITLEPDDNVAPAAESAPMLIPQSGCTVAYPNYEAGAGGPDCAVIKADARQNTEVYTIPFASNREGYWAGRFSIKGTIYAPSSAVEVDDGDNAYPLATRGVVVRHLRLSGWKYRPGYQGTPISNSIDRTPAPREATFLACSQSAARVTANAPCDSGSGDQQVAAARVRFDVNSAGTAANVPQIVWWSTDT